MPSCQGLVVLLVLLARSLTVNIYGNLAHAILDCLVWFATVPFRHDHYITRISHDCGPLPRKTEDMW